MGTHPRTRTRTRTHARARPRSYMGRDFLERHKYYKKSKVIPAAGREGLQGCEMLWISHCLDNRLTVAAPDAFCSPETLLFLCFWYSFLLEAE
jgi:hypothetical protein